MNRAMHDLSSRQALHWAVTPAFQTSYPGAHLMVVDDERSNLRLLQAVLGSAGFERITPVDDARLVLPELESKRPDLLVLDISMPFLSGLDILVRLPSSAAKDVPVLMLTAHDEPEIKQRALRLGASDFVTRPFDKAELLLRVENILRTRMLQLELKLKNDELELRVDERTRELSSALAMVTQSREEALWLIGLVLEYRDFETKGHTERVTRLALALGKALGLGEPQLDHLRWGACLHDIGKIAISDRILLKPGPLSAEEFALVKRHVLIGESMLRQMDFLPQPVIDIVRHHHERWDGCGYPEGLAGEHIPYLARLFSVADVYDALVSTRPYKPAWTHFEAQRELLRQKGKQFDPRLVDAFLTLDIAATLEPMAQMQG
jgi:putative two-component system response regulator